MIYCVFGKNNNRNLKSAIGWTSRGQNEIIGKKFNVMKYFLEFANY